MATEYGFHSIPDNRDYAFASGTTYKEALSYISDLSTQYVVQREPVEWTRAEAPLPTTVGSLIEASTNNTNGLVRFALDTDGSWAMLDGFANYVDPLELTDVTVLFEAP